MIMIVRTSDNIKSNGYSSYAFTKNGNIIAAIKDGVLVELQEYKDQFELVAEGNLHPVSYNPDIHYFFMDQTKDIQDQLRKKIR